MKIAAQGFLKKENVVTAKEESTPTPLPPRPSANDPTVWKIYWKAQGQSWRSEPEINVERQDELKQCLKIVPHIANSIYPFKGMKLVRADVEWLLAMQDAGQGFVKWENEQERQRFGLDMRGADLRQVDMRRLPLTRLRGGLSTNEWWEATEEQRTMAIARMEKANFRGAKLEGVNFRGAKLEGVNFRGAKLEEADFFEAELMGADLGGAELTETNLGRARLERANLGRARLERANLGGARLERANLSGARLERASLIGADLTRANLRGADLTEASIIEAKLARADLRNAKLKGTYLIEAGLTGASLNEAELQGANLRGAQLTGANLIKTNLSGANLRGAELQGAYLNEANLSGANLNGAELQGAYLNEANLSGANLSGARLEGANLSGARLEGANLSGARLEGANLSNVILIDKRHIGPWLADVQWGSSNLAVVDWSQVVILFDEYTAHQKKTSAGSKKDANERLNNYQTAVRANRQLAVALQAQGLNEEATNFAYSAQRLQRIILRRQHKVGQYLFSGFLDLLAGYGYKPGRSVLAYLVVIVGFMLLYLLNAHFVSPHLRWDEALVLSVSSFHGRGFFTQDISLGDTYARLAAAEAVIGLIIEISFIATFTQRFFGK